MNDDLGIHRLAFRNPELPPRGMERGEQDEFDELLCGMLDLTSAEGGVSGSNFVLRMVEAMGNSGLELNDVRVSMLAKYGFGERADVRKLIAGMSDEELVEAYPNHISDLLTWYAFPDSE
ncbi:MAG: hypothetical protein NVS1B7_8560 [Candidatus Saccharimonadales bacterium]